MRRRDEEKEETRMEIERKWLVDGWPDADLQLLSEQKIRQG